MRRILIALGLAAFAASGTLAAPHRADAQAAPTPASSFRPVPGVKDAVTYASVIACENDGSYEAESPVRSSSGPW